MRITRSDILLIIVLLLAAGAVAAGSPSTDLAREVRFFADNEPVKTVTLGNHNSKPIDITIKSDEGKVDFVVKDGRVKAISADCPNKICVNMGWKDRPGQTIVCAPNRIFAVLAGKDKENPDCVLR